MGGGPIAIENVVWFKLNVFRVASITEDHKDDDDQDYLGGACAPPGPLLGTPLGITSIGIDSSSSLSHCCVVNKGAADHVL